MPLKKKHLTRKRKTAKAKGKADILPFLLKQKLSSLTNEQKQTTLKNIFSNLPRQSVEDVITQKELAQKCNMDVSIINEIERGTCVYNATHVNKIQSVLGVKIPRV